MILARDLDYGIGFGGRIPWRCPKDMEHFQATTTKTIDAAKFNAVVMGRRTWESLRGRALPRRVNICVSSTEQDIRTAASLKAALDLANECPDVESIFVIGGVHVYREAFEEQFVGTVYETVIKDRFPADRFVRFLPKYLVDYKLQKTIYQSDEFETRVYEQTRQ